MSRFNFFGITRADKPWSFARCGFSLLELLVGMTLLSLLVVAMMSLVDSATKLWRINEDRVETYREARAALSLIRTDLQSLYPSLKEGHFLVDQASPDGDSRIAFLASLPIMAQDSGNLSDLCVVGFFLAKGRISDIGPESTTQSYNLYRYLLNSNSTFEILSQDPDGINADGLFSEASMRPRELADPPRTEILARNIRSFVIRPMVKNGADWEPWERTEDTPLPELLEIELVAVSNDWARRTEGAIKDELPNLEKESHKWVTRVPLQQPFPDSLLPAPSAP